MDPHLVAETGGAALLLAATLMWGGRVHPFRAYVRDRRSIVSFGAGLSIAYVFVHVMPELHSVRQALAESVSTHLRYEGMAIYFTALIGFLIFYGVDHLRTRLRGQVASQTSGSAFRIHVAGFAAYVWLMAYLLVHNLEETPVSIGLYTVAIAFHMLGIDRALRDEYGATYDLRGRHVLAVMPLLGWGFGELVALPRHVLALLVAFVSGAIVMNSTIMELPSEKDGRFLPFVAGGILYGLMLLPLG